MFSVNFCNGCLVHINCPDKKSYRVVIYDNENILIDEFSSGQIVMHQNDNATVNYKYINYKVDIFQDSKLVYSEVINLKGKKVKINFDSQALGDNIAWISQVDRFQKIHQCELYVSCHYRDLFQEVYPNLFFYDAIQKDCEGKNTIIPGMKNLSCKNFFCFYDPCNCYYASYDLGFYSLLPKLRNVTLSKIASDLLGISYEETIPEVYIKDKIRKHNKSYVCIAVQSTAQYKYWNNKNGWQVISDYLKSIGYDVICIDKNDHFGSDGFINSAPSDIINKTGDFSLQERITDILHCDFFIGLGSGLSWLAWSLKKPVIMISGFSNPKSEFSNPYRVFNPNVCNSCWNDESVSSHIKNGWDYCPRNKNYECSSEISPQMIIEMINQCIKDNKFNT